MGLFTVKSRHFTCLGPVAPNRLGVRTPLINHPLVKQKHAMQPQTAQQQIHLYTLE